MMQYLASLEGGGRGGGSYLCLVRWVVPQRGGAGLRNDAGQRTGSACGRTEDLPHGVRSPHAADTPRSGTAADGRWVCQAREHGGRDCWWRVGRDERQRHPATAATAGDPSRGQILCGGGSLRVNERGWIGLSVGHGISGPAHSGS